MSQAEPHREIIAPLSRRTPIGTGGEFEPSRMPRLEIPRPARLAVLLAVVRWTARWLQLQGLILLDIFSGQRSEERTAQHAYHILAGADPVVRKVAQLFAYRFDLLPVPTAMALARLNDVIDPLETAVAIGVVERGLGGPLEGVFSAFDPVPLGSRVLRATYQGVLHDGSAVIVRIRPPGMRQRLLDELTALGGLLAVLELFTLVRPGFFTYLRTENATLLMEEADFRHQARSQRLFEKRTKRDKLDFAKVAPLYEAWVCDNLMIVGKVDGVWLPEVMAAVESGDAQRLAGLRAQGIEPEALARRLMQLGWWEQIEHLFFQAAPIPADVVVMTGGDLAVMHFTTTASTTGRHRRLLRDLYARVAEEDASGATEALIQFLLPMPFIDTHAFFKRVEARVWHQILAMHDRQALWWERTSVGLWAALLSATREEGIQVHLEVIHLMRSSMMFEGMAFRLNPDIHLVKEYRRYRRKADSRTARRLGRDLQHALGKRPMAVIAARVAEGASLARRVGDFIEVRLENLPITNLAMPRKAAYVASVVLQTVTLGLVTALVGVGVSLLTHLTDTRSAVDFTQETLKVLHHPAYITVVSVLGLIAVRRILFRLGDKDPEETR